MGFSSKFASMILIATTRVLSEKFTYHSSETSLDYPLNAIYNETFETIDPETEMTISSDEIAIDIRLINLPITPRQGDEITRIDNSLIFIIKDVINDGQGGSSLIVFEKI